MANARKRCKHCKTYKPAKDGIQTPSGWFCEPGHAFGWAQANWQRGKAVKDKAFKQKVRNFRLNDLRHQHALTQAVANKLCNLLDAFKPCISCGRRYEGARKRNASHLKSRGANSYLRYDLRNLHSSCVVCNLHLSGNIEGYKAGVRGRYGQWIIDYLESAPRSKDWSAPDLIELRRSYNEEIRHIRAGNPPTRSWRALPEESR